MIAFLFEDKMALLQHIYDCKFLLNVPKGKESVARLADFLDKCPDINVTRIYKKESFDVIKFDVDRFDLSYITEEVCNAINDVYDADVRIPRGNSVPPPILV